MNPPAHDYEELREIVVDIILGKAQVSYSADQFGHLEIGVAEVLDRRENPQQQQVRPRRSRSKDRAKRSRTPNSDGDPTRAGLRVLAVVRPARSNALSATDGAQRIGPGKKFSMP